MIVFRVSGLRSVGLLRSDTKRFGDGVLFDPQKRNLNSSNRCTFEGVSGLVRFESHYFGIWVSRDLLACTRTSWNVIEHD